MIMHGVVAPCSRYTSGCRKGFTEEAGAENKSHRNDSETQEARIWGSKGSEIEKRGGDRWLGAFDGKRMKEEYSRHYFNVRLRIYLRFYPWTFVYPSNVEFSWCCNFTAEQRANRKQKDSIFAGRTGNESLIRKNSSLIPILRLATVCPVKNR